MTMRFLFSFSFFLFFLSIHTFCMRPSSTSHHTGKKRETRVGLEGGGQFKYMSNMSGSLTCARLDANRVDRGSKLQTGHQLMGFFRLFGLALVVAAVDTTTSRVTPQVRPPWSRGTITCDSATSTSHSTCLRYNNGMTEVVFSSQSAGVR